MGHGGDLGHDRDHYQRLGVARTATVREIRRAYRRLARRYHPDLNPGSEDSAARFAAVHQAYTILSDRARRAGYDHAMAADPAPAPPRTPHPPSEQRLVRHGVLELSAREAWHLAHAPLRLTAGRGTVFTVPAGARDGDQIHLREGAVDIVLTIRTKDLTEPG
jgi:hypothetical protein